MRFYYFAVMIAGILILLNMAGIVTPTGSLVNFANIVDDSGNTTIQDFKSSGLWGSTTKTNSLVFVLGGLLIAGIVIGTFGRVPDIRFVTAAFVLLVTGMMVGDLIWLYTYIRSLGVEWVTMILGLLIGASLIGLVITAIQYWQGSD